MSIKFNSSPIPTISCFRNAFIIGTNRHGIQQVFYQLYYTACLFPARLYSSLIVTRTLILLSLLLLLLLLLYYPSNVVDQSSAEHIFFSGGRSDLNRNVTMFPSWPLFPFSKYCFKSSYQPWSCFTGLDYIINITF
jgi:hypothetical protein